MSDSEQIQVAKRFIDSHKNNNHDDWFLQCQRGSDDEQYLEIYAKLEGGVFGECRDNAEYDEDGDLIKAPTEFEVEIRGSESKTGNPIIFEWELND